MSLAENLGDLERHAHDYEQRTGFTYTVLAPDADEVLGCVYIYPSRDEGHDADVRSWVRADVAELDGALHAASAAGSPTTGPSTRSTTPIATRRPGRRWWVGRVC
jgi:hypothetical protein